MLMKQRCWDNKLPWICCLHCARQHIASAFWRSRQRHIALDPFVCTQSNTTGFNPPLDIAKMCSFKRHLQVYGQRSPRSGHRVPPSACFGLWTSLCCARTFAGTQQQRSRTSTSERGGHVVGHICAWRARMCQPPSPKWTTCTLRGAWSRRPHTKPQWTSPPSEMKTTPSSTCMGMRSKRKRPRKRATVRVTCSADEQVSAAYDCAWTRDT